MEMHCSTFSTARDAFPAFASIEDHPQTRMRSLTAKLQPGVAPADAKSSTRKGSIALRYRSLMTNGEGHVVID